MVDSCLLSLTLFCDASMLGTCFVMQYLHVIMYFIVLQQPRRGRERAGCFIFIVFFRGSYRVGESLMCLYLTVLWVSLCCLSVLLPGLNTLTCFLKSS